MHIRPVTAADHPRLANIATLTGIKPVSLEEFTSGLEHSVRQGPVVCLAAELEGTVAGYGLLSRGPWLPGNGVYLGVRVHPDYTGRGVGSALSSALEEQAKALGFTMAEIGVRDHRPDWLAFAQRRGYWVKEHFFNSELDLSKFDSELYRRSVALAEANGYRFITMADVPAEEGHRRLYELDMECSKDEPDKGENWEPIDFAEYCKDNFDPAQYDPKAVFLAVKDGEFVGVSGCHFPPGRESAWVFFTGVRRPHRGQRLAQALKLLACQYVKEHTDYTKIATGNHARNESMLAINRKFGFVPMPGSYILRKSLGS